MAFGHLRERAIAEKKERERVGKIALAKARAAYKCYFCESQNRVEPTYIDNGTKQGTVILICVPCSKTYERFIKVKVDDNG